MNKIRVMEPERIEAMVASWDGRKILARVPLGGTVSLGFYGTLTSTIDDCLDPLFIITRSDVPSPALSFYCKDIDRIMNINSDNPIIVLNKMINVPQMYE